MIDEQIQKELVDDIFQACENENLKEVVTLTKKINFKDDYHKNNLSAKQIFSKACLTGNLDLVESLFYIPKSYNEQNNDVITYALESLIKVNEVKSHHVITHLINRPKFQGNRSREFKETLNWGLHFAAKNDDAILFKLLLNFNQNKKSNTWFFESLGVYTDACENNNKGDIIKYILNEPELADDVNPQICFMMACNYKNISVLQFLIYEYNIEKVIGLDLNNKDNICEEANRMFEIKYLNIQLNNDLEYNNEVNKKIKV